MKKVTKLVMIGAACLAVGISFWRSPQTQKWLYDPKGRGGTGC
jgi:hypothetical protein